MMSPPTNDSDDDYVEEELLVYADFQSKIASSTLRDSANVKIIGMETGQPIMEIGDKIFQGNFEHAIGTMLFFDENPVPPPSLENYETTPDKWYKYLCKTDRVLRMDRIFIDARDEERPAAADGAAAPPATAGEHAAAEAAVAASAAESGRPGAASDSTTTENTRIATATPIPIVQSYAMALNQFLKPGEQPPRPPDMADEEFFRRFGTLEATLGGGGDADADADTENSDS